METKYSTEVEDGWEVVNSQSYILDHETGEFATKDELVFCGTGPDGHGKDVANYRGWTVRSEAEARGWPFLLSKPEPKAELSMSQYTEICKAVDNKLRSRLSIDPMDSWRLRSEVLTIVFDEMGIKVNQNG